MQGSQFTVPVRFQLVGYQTVVGIDPQVAAACQVGFLLGTLHDLAPKAIDFFESSFHFPLHSQGYFQIRRIDGL